MKTNRSIFISLAFIAIAFLFQTTSSAQTKFYDVRELGLPLANQCFKDCVKDFSKMPPIYYNEAMQRIPADQVEPGTPATDGYYSRLPICLEGVVRDAVWDLAQNSAGIAVRFRSNSKNISVRWTLLSNFRMNHMTTVGICGMDMYAYDNGRWRFAGVAVPRGKKTSEATILSGTDGKMRDYLIFLPLYDGVIDMAIGIDEEAVIEQPTQIGDNLFGGTAKKPILFYGTSGTQGGCANRPGMVYTSILSRMMKRECVNLGFSGNGRMDSVVAAEMAKVDAAAYVLDCMGNCTIDGVRDSTDRFVRTLLTAHPETPVIMLSSFPWPTLWMSKNMEAYEAKDKVWRDFYLKYRDEGFKNIMYIDLKGTHNPDEPMEGTVAGPDDEYTVDGGHFTDLGFQRIANFLFPYLRNL